MFSVETWRYVTAFLTILSLMLIPLIGSLGAVGFILFGILFCSVDFATVITKSFRYIYLLIFPLYCILSYVWSAYPDVTIRYAIQLFATLGVALVISSSLNSSKLISVIFYSYLFSFIICVFIEVAGGDGNAWAGFYGSKNGFASLTSMLLLVSLAIRNITRIRALRLLVSCYIISAPIFIGLAQSAGAILAILPVIGCVVFFRSLATMSHSARVAFTFVLFAFSIIVCYVISAHSDEITAEILAYFGKSPDLTGRTDLWEYAYYLIERKPFFGVGYRGFWVMGNADAEMLWAEFHVPSGAGFNFHNTYISNAVEIGYVGVAIQIFIMYFALFRGFKLCVSAPTPENIFWFTVIAFSLSRSFSEVTFFTEFSIESFLPYLAYVQIDRSNRAVQKTVNIYERRI